jgi:hypothetical protein
MDIHIDTRATLATVLLALGLGPAQAQAPESSQGVTWTSRAVAVQAPGGERLYRLHFEGRIQPGYIVYGSDFKAGLGPNPTRLRLDKDQQVTLRAPLESEGTKAGKDEAFDVPYTYFENEARLTQLIAVPLGVTQVTGTLRGQTCHLNDGTCQLFSARFEIPLP